MHVDSSKFFLIQLCAFSPLYRPLERSSEDVDIIFTRLKEVKAFEKFHPNLLHQICLCGYYENLEKGITCKKCNSSDVFSYISLWSSVVMLWGWIANGVSLCQTVELNQRYEVDISLSLFIQFYTSISLTPLSIACKWFFQGSLLFRWSRKDLYIRQDPWKF